jgi:hypothetical protein
MPFDGEDFRTSECLEAKILAEAMALIHHKQYWCQGASIKGHLAHTEHGREEWPMYCMGGAVDAASHQLSRQHGEDTVFSPLGEKRMKVLAVLEFLACRRGYRSFVKFNDSPDTTHEDVLGLMQEAYRILRRRGVMMSLGQ